MANGAERRPSPPDRSSSLEVQLDRERARVAELERELHGVPLRWPEDVPEAARPAVFEANLRRAIAECGVEFQDLSFDCIEPPCYATFRRPELVFTSADAWNVRLRNCDALNEVYDDRWSTATFPVECPDGTEQGATMLALRPIDDPEWLGSDDDEEFVANYMKRLETRRRALEERWRCSAN